MNCIKGDILTPNEAEDHMVLVCHQVNCQGVMGAGLALQIKNRHPNVYQLYKDKCLQIKAGIGGLGDVQYCSVLADAGYLVVNIFAQNSYGRDRQHTDYAALRKAVEHIARGFPKSTIRIPYGMGCGLGGGNWDIVLQIIDETLLAKGLDVEIWQLPPSQTNRSQKRRQYEKNSTETNDCN